MLRYLDTHPLLGQQFNNHMSGYRQGRPSWMDANFYPVQDQLIDGMDNSKDAVLLVDIGGGYGHDVQDFRTKYPQRFGPSIECMEYDFHTGRPLKATSGSCRTYPSDANGILVAKAYYMHSVLRDWPDDVCKSILKQVAGAMKKGYSKLLINENVIPDKGADWQATALDMMMITLFSSKERTYSQWSQLLESPELGLKIVRVWTVKHSQESLIECELV
ncbi:S-adenosyl-L-methionine-dependent methyltransferase [Alternaria rosae]|uniref:S-adenosyl-L-methionine-dependent methyltransferase n=1 Tax=Alternaria rosae TaxID=1187941 RepID=UPI001E8CDBFA|nr:S-adenosyl-L-methionine-dependent methyltransferase [Alternaria rosae]KAH6866914.1 S-adenosyl-L-methionine-dependent methyltransferase [Alternaria rosae]